MSDKEDVLRILGSTIRRLREERKMSLDELARRSGYTSDSSRSTMQKIEAGKRDVPASKLKAIAIALGTTPGELIGMVSNPDPAPAAPPSLSSDEKILVDGYRKLNDLGKDKLRSELDDMLELDKYVRGKEGLLVSRIG